jgi:hypothetical protein
MLQPINNNADNVHFIFKILFFVNIYSCILYCTTKKQLKNKKNIFQLANEIDDVLYCSIQ